MDQKQLISSLRRVQRRQKLVSFSLTAPLILYIALTFAIPLFLMLGRSVDSPEVHDALPRTVIAIKTWEGNVAPPSTVYNGLIEDLSNISDDTVAGNLARRLNSEIPGFRSLIMKTFREVRDNPNPTVRDARARLEETDARWSDPSYWKVIRANASSLTPRYLLSALDLKMGTDGAITKAEEGSSAFVDILLRTLYISAAVAGLCLLLGYPLAYWISTLSRRWANIVMLLVLLPFWTSILVKIAAWIALLQRNGAVNQIAHEIGLISSPLELMFNRTGVVITMTHIMLPFMIFPLYGVMKGISPNYVRAAVSMGARPLAAFFKVYIPQTYVGVTAGALIVFISTIGYYVTPALVGGASDQMLSYYIDYFINTETNWGMACALSAVLLVATTGLYLIYDRCLKGASYAQ